ncbi:MAG: two-component system, OmpR family, response regulator [Solirubrobacteraceae bacterium]|jgi:two-component system OmpR family response regulator|nr:two-component system, OmpR family, response regulator [Solirubrobacteraceae bacterium]
MRVLVVEDDEKLAAAVVRGLRHEGYAVDHVSDGEAALVNAAVYEYDAVVLDLMLPLRDGLEVCRLMRERGNTVPVLMLTARGDVADRIGGLDSGADDYLVKPFDFGELLARLRALIRRTPVERPARLEVGDLVVDPAARTVVHAGSRVELTAREFAILELLARRPGQVVSRTTLLEHVWDANFYGSTNIVDVYVGYLRRKLGSETIQTVRGVGFKLQAP